MDQNTSANLSKESKKAGVSQSFLTEGALKEPLLMGYRMAMVNLLFQAEQSLKVTYRKGTEKARQK